MISRRWWAYSSMIRRASSERDGFVDGSSLPKYGLSDGFMSQRSDRPKGDR